MITARRFHRPGYSALGRVRHDTTVGIAVRVQEFSGVLVQRLDGPADVAALCAFVTTEPGVYPMLAGVDPYDDTCFNPDRRPY